MTERQVCRKLADACAESTNQSVARACGVTPEFISQVVHGHRRPSEKILAYLGLHKIVTVSYEKRTK